MAYTESAWIPTTITILLWGSYLAPVKKSKLEPEAQIFFLSVGNLVFTSLLFLINSYSLSISSILYSFAGGVIWAVGGIAAFFGIKYLGLTRGPGIWIPGKTLASFLIGIAFFGELVNESNSVVGLSLISIVLLLAGMMIIILNSKTQEFSDIKLRAGLVVTLLVIVFWSFYLVPVKMLPDPEYAKLFPMAIGMLAGTSTFGVRKMRNASKFSISLNLFSGVLWGIANYTSFLMFDLLGVGRGFALSQLSLIVNALWGIFVFNEVRDARMRIKILFGMVIALIGGILLSVSKI